MRRRVQQALVTLVDDPDSRVSGGAWSCAASISKGLEPAFRRELMDKFRRQLPVGTSRKIGEQRSIVAAFPEECGSNLRAVAVHEGFEQWTGPWGGWEYLHHSMGALFASLGASERDSFLERLIGVVAAPMPSPADDYPDRNTKDLVENIAHLLTNDQAARLVDALLEVSRSEESMARREAAACLGELRAFIPESRRGDVLTRLVELHAEDEFYDSMHTIAWTCGEALQSLRPIIKGPLVDGVVNGLVALTAHPTYRVTWIAEETLGNLGGVFPEELNQKVTAALRRSLAEKSYVDAEKATSALLQCQSVPTRGEWRDLRRWALEKVRDEHILVGPAATERLFREGGLSSADIGALVEGFHWGLTSSRREVRGAAASGVKAAADSLPEGLLGPLAIALAKAAAVPSGNWLDYSWPALEVVFPKLGSTERHAVLSVVQGILGQGNRETGNAAIGFLSRTAPLTPQEDQEWVRRECLARLAAQIGNPPRMRPDMVSFAATAALRQLRDGLPPPDRGAIEQLFAKRVGEAFDTITGSRVAEGFVEAAWLKTLWPAMNDQERATSVSNLADCMESPRSSTRRIAAEAAGQVAAGISESARAALLTPLCKLADDPSYFVRFRVADALAQMGLHCGSGPMGKVLSHLVSLANSDDYQTSDHGMEALGKIVGRCAPAEQKLIVETLAEISRRGRMGAWRARRALEAFYLEAPDDLLPLLISGL